MLFPVIPSTVLQVCLRLRQEGFQAWVVGGAVRDSLMGREVHDWDLATDAHPGRVMQMFEKVLPTGFDFGTVTVIQKGEGVEVTTFRGDGAYSDGRRPDSVTFVKDITFDLGRRDFTINSIAWDPIDQLFCDPFGGRQDIQARLIRTVGTAQHRFTEDALRMMRAARFAASLEFTVAPSTLAGICECADKIVNVSLERVHDELVKMMSAPRPSRGLKILADTGLLGQIIPEFIPSFGCVQNQFHAWDVWTHTWHVVDACPQDRPLLRLAALFHDIGKPSTKGIHKDTGDFTFYDHQVVGAAMTDQILTRLKFSREDRERIVRIVRHHLLLGAATWSDATLRRWVRKVGPDLVTDLCMHVRADILGKGPTKTLLDTLVAESVEKRVAAMDVKTVMFNLAVSGRDVMEILGLSPGKQVGDILHEISEMVVDDPNLNDREVLLQFLHSRVRGPDDTIPGVM